MKKIAAAVLALAMCASMSVTAFAEEETLTSKTGSQNIDVKAQYTENVSNPDVYSVDIEWGKMEFTYSVAGTKTWDPAAHTYTDTSTPSWSAEGNTITVTNHSNKAVNAAFSFEKKVTDSISGSFDKTSEALAAGVENKPDEAANVIATLTMSGVLGTDKSTMTKVGTATVTLS